MLFRLGRLRLRVEILAREVTYRTRRALRIRTRGGRELRHLFEDYNECIVLITGRNADGDEVAGSGFHVGRGWIATARHVADVRQLEIHYKRHVLSIGRVHFHKDENIDLAIIETDFEEKWFAKVSYLLDPRRTYGRSSFIPLGGHTDDYLDDGFVLSKILLMGYPRVPMTAERPMVAVVGEVNALVDKYRTDHPHFVVSVVPRGGFSGGPVLSEWGFLLGVLTDSLTADPDLVETGFAAVLTIEPLLEILAEHEIVPPDWNAKLWHDIVGTTNSGTTS